MMSELQIHLWNQVSPLCVVKVRPHQQTDQDGDTLQSCGAMQDEQLSQQPANKVRDNRGNHCLLPGVKIIICA